MRMCLAIIASVGMVACGSSSTGASLAHSPAASPSPAAVKLTAAQRAAVQADLAGSTTHFEDLLAAGKAALGTERYADGSAGLMAMDNPTSGAARFRDWRSSSKAEQDQSFLAAFKTADSNYNADNEPDAITAWRDDMGTMTGDLVTWIQTAAEWQISSKSDAELAAAEKTVNDDLAKARADIAATISAS